jgi:hypothetical protein
VSIDDPEDVSVPFSPQSIRPGETVLHRWSSPGGRGLLTNLRCLLLGHPHPIHRFVRWTIDLQDITSLSVEVVDSVSGYTGPGASFGGGERVVVPGSIDSVDHAVLVNQIPVYVGEPRPCANIQAWVDGARTARCVALFGRLLPFRPPPTPLEDPDADPSPIATAPPAGDVVTTAMATLFLSGVPWQPTPGGWAAGAVGRPFVGQVGSIPAFGVLHEPAPIIGRRVAGWEAEVGRMVLEIAARLGVSVKIVDVERPGADRGLVESCVSPDDPLPILLRADGQRIEGDEAFQPHAIERFLRGN